MHKKSQFGADEKKRAKWARSSADIRFEVGRISFETYDDIEVALLILLL